MSEESREKGLALIAELFGPPTGGGTPQPQPLGRYTVEHLFGDVWHFARTIARDLHYAVCSKSSRRNDAAFPWREEHRGRAGKVGWGHRPRRTLCGLAQCDGCLARLE